MALIGPLLPFNSWCFDAYLWIVAQAPYRFGIFRIFMLNLSVVQMYPNVMSIEHGKVPGLRQKVQELQARLDWCQCNIDIFERGGNCSTHFWDLLGSLRGTDDVCFAVNLLCFYFYHSFVCFCSRKRPWDMRPLGRARAPQWWQLAPAALSVAWGDCWPVRETPRRGGLSIVIGANMVTMTSLYIYEILWT